MDCSYGGYDAPLSECWRKLEPFVERGPLLLPIPANGRGPEIALELLRHGRTDIFVDDSMQKALQQLGDGAAISLHDNVGGEIKRLASTVKPIDGARGIMLAGSADGTSGATARLFGEWQDKPEPAIVFTGYVNPTTPADRLVKSGRAQFMRWNVHPRLSDTVTLVRATQAKTVIPAFCDRSQLAALAAAFAPARVTMDGDVAI
jgi:Cft2 family RNA processing exonuclease